MNRESIKNYILKVEQEFPVDKWIVEGLHIWPIIRVNLYFALVYETSPKSQNKKKQKLSIIYKLRSYFYHLRNYYLNPIKPKSSEIVFAGATVHREKYQDFLFNRFLDSYIEMNNLKLKSTFLEVGPIPENVAYFNDPILIKTQNKLMSYKYIFKNEHQFELSKRLVKFSEFLQSIELLELELNINEFKEEYINKLINNVLLEVQFYKKLLLKVKPKKLISLCYYSVDIYPLVIAANQLDIHTIEYQHGPQTDTHLAYSNWSKIPSMGYSYLPNEFWSWDEGSAEVIRTWTKDHAIYKAQVKGNFWIDKWKNDTVKLTSENFILYTLQPEPVKYEELFSDEIIEVIKESGLIWLIRFHPRQKDSVDEIKQLLSTQLDLSMLEFEEANTLPLPVLLANCQFHVTHFSGSAIEASFLNKKTIFLNELATTAFAQLISSNEGYYFNPKASNFKQMFLDKANTLLTKQM